MNKKKGFRCGECFRKNKDKTLQELNNCFLDEYVKSYKYRYDEYAENMIHGKDDENFDFKRFSKEFFTKEGTLKYLEDLNSQREKEGRRKLPFFPVKLEIGKGRTWEQTYKNFETEIQKLLAKGEFEEFEIGEDISNNPRQVRFYYVYIKFIIIENESYAVVCGETTFLASDKQNYPLDHIGDISFSTKLSDGTSRQIIDRNGYKWDENEIIVIPTLCKNECRRIEGKIIYDLELLGS